MLHRILSVLCLVGGLAPPVAAQDFPEGAPVPAVPLHMAALQGDLQMVRQHVAAGTDLDAYDPYGSTPLLAATTFGRTEVVRLLVEAGADPALGNAQGSNPLHVAAFLGRAPIVRVLLDHGANPSLLNDDGALALDLAAVPAARDRPLLDQFRAGLAPLGWTWSDAQVEAGRAQALEMLRPRGASVPEVDFRPATEADPVADVLPAPEVLPPAGVVHASGGGWPVSTPEEEGLDPALVALLYADAEALTAIRGLLVVKNGRLVAERYFNDGALEEPALLQSVTKSVTSALVGIALETGCLESLDQRMLDFFPDQAPRVRDPRKREITLRQMLQMRAGYGWEGSDSLRWEGLIGGDYLPLLVDFPLERDPGSGFDYSNVTSQLLGVAVARGCRTDLLDFATEHLFGPLGIHPGGWRQDPYGYRYGHGELHLTARDAARFGQLYLAGGLHEGRQLIPVTWVEASLTGYSSQINTAGLRAGTVGRYFREVEYGFQWWSARVGERRFHFAWGHGGQMIVLLPDLEMVVVVTSDPFYRPIREDHEGWKHEQANFNLVGRFLAALPSPEGAIP